MTNYGAFRYPLGVLSGSRRTSCDADEADEDDEFGEEVDGENLLEHYVTAFFLGSVNATRSIEVMA